MQKGIAKVDVKIGYARVSTDDQNMAAQLDALERAGCDKIFEDQGISGSVKNRPGLAQALKALKPGNILVVWKLDRLGRSLTHLIQNLNEFSERDVQFQSLTENIDTTSAGGRLIFHLMGALAEFERSLISERTRAGMAAARKRGKRMGRPRALKPKQIRFARDQLRAGETSMTTLAEILNVHTSTLSRALSR